ncbi:MAG: hypothetical protein AAGC60_21295 [Acidobacteriota bacterium]
MRIPKQCPDVIRGLEAPAMDANTIGVVPAGFWDSVKSFAGNYVLPTARAIGKALL